MFGFGKKKQTLPTTLTTAEFEADLKREMDNPDNRCQRDIAEKLWRKYRKLSDSAQSEEEVSRAIMLIGILTETFEWPVEALLYMGEVCEHLLDDLNKAAGWYKKAADLDSAQGARCYANLIMAGAIKQTQAEAVRYYMQASAGGIGEASFVLGEIAQNQGQKEAALECYRIAREQGYAPAQQRIDQMTGGK